MQTQINNKSTETTTISCVVTHNIDVELYIMPTHANNQFKVQHATGHCYHVIFNGGNGYTLVCHKQNQYFESLVMDKVKIEMRSLHMGKK